MTLRRWVWAVPPLLAVAVVSPLLTGRGFALVGDMVFVPEQPWKPAWYGGDGGVPRAVPSDAWVSLATNVVPGDVLQKAVLLALLTAAGWGVLRLLADLPPGAALAGAVLYQWNPYVHERLGIGHWALLCGYAALPWCVVGARRVLDDGARGLPWLVVPLGVAAACSPTGGVLAALVALGVVTAGTVVERVGMGRLAVTVGAALVVNLPWLLPGLLNGADLAPDPGGASAFAARADTPWGLGPSLLTLGAIWKSAIAPGERTSWLVSGVALAVSIAALAGAAWRLGQGTPRDRVVLLGVGVPAVVLLVAAYGLSTGTGRPAMEWLITEAAGAGLVRDAQKLTAVLALLLALGFGYAVAAVTEHLPVAGRPIVTVAAVVLPLALLPSMVWGLVGFLRPATYPAEWTEVAAVLDRAGAADDRVLALPFSVYRRFPWAHDRAVLDPAPRFFPGQVVSDDSLPLGAGRVVAGEAADAAAVRRAVVDGTLPQTAHDLGIRWVLVERTTPGTSGWPEDAGTTVHEGPELLLVDLGTGAAPDVSRWRGLYVGADLVVAVMVGGSALVVAGSGLRRMYAGGRRDADVGGGP